MEPRLITELSERDQVLASLADSISPFTPILPMPEELNESLQSLYTDQELAEILMITGVLAGIGAVLVAAGFVPLECEI
jgi:hypothetical protein